VHQLDVTDDNATREFVQRAFEDTSTLRRPCCWWAVFDGQHCRNQLVRPAPMFRLNFESCYNLARPAFLRMQWQENGGRLVYWWEPAGLGNGRPGKRQSWWLFALQNP
jgi:hypothetical protein